MPRTRFWHRPRRERSQPTERRGLPAAAGRPDPPAGRLLLAAAVVLAAAALALGPFSDVLRRQVLTVDAGQRTTRPPVAAAPEQPAGGAAASGGQLPPATGRPSASWEATELTISVSGELVLPPAAAQSALTPLTSLLSSADLAICQGPAPTGQPGPVAEALRRVGFDACATATTATVTTAATGRADRRDDPAQRDQAERDQAERRLLDALDAATISHSGTARDDAEADTLTLLPVRGAQVALLSYAEDRGAEDGNAQDGGAGMLPAHILSDAGRAREAGADLVLVLVDWATSPAERRRSLAGELLASPLVDLVIGTGPVRAIERVNSKYVAYGTGALAPAGPDRDGLLLHAQARRTALGWLISGVTYSPTWSSDDGVILPVADTLDAPGTPPSLRSELTASWLRTVAAVAAAGPVDGVRPERAPR
ncbi:CapA family protein [Frankia sp. EI5c]|uniref:CapA family protein n=1 Tax=Frankia sp. EI5c TaxID=683316 RepID=UPI001F5B4955|nr:CapA family protein [Frankia sp. EI5c]